MSGVCALVGLPTGSDALSGIPVGTVDGSDRWWSDGGWTTKAQWGWARSKAKSKPGGGEVGRGWIELTRKW